MWCQVTMTLLLSPLPSTSPTMESMYLDVNLGTYGYAFLISINWKIFVMIVSIDRQ